jgi:O-succinylbenzoic acid--CoA ligase
VALSHANLDASAERVAERLGLTPEDRWLAVLSPGHVGGLALLHRATWVGSAVVARPRFDASEVAHLIESGEVSHASLVPVMLARLLECWGRTPVPETLRCLLVGGAATPPPLLERALGLGYPVALTYGLTEATSQVATATPDEVRADPGSVGRPLPGTELRIDGPRDGAVGEILVRGPTVAARVPAGRDEDSVGGEGGVRIDGDGWLHTGDLGWLDGGGRLRVVGRRTDRIVSAGVTVDPAEVEAAIAGSPGVRELAVFGLPDPEWGERVVVAVVPVDPDAPPTLDGILAVARGRLAPAKRPRELRIVASLPRNESGKVQRRRLREEAARGR